MLFVAAVVLPLLRQTGTRSWQGLFSEDGPIYAQPVIRGEGWSVLLRGYAGYLQLPPRLLALGVSFVPLRQLALYLAIAAAVTNALLAWFVYRHSDGWIASWFLRLALAASVVLAPVMLQENTANITNTIWTFLAVAPWAFLSRRTTPGAVAARSVVVFLTATASALAFLYLPLAVLALVIRRTRASAAVTVSFFVGLALQAAVTATSPRTGAFVGNDAGDLLREVGVRVFWPFLAGQRFLRWMPPSPSMTLSMVAVVGTLALLAVAGIGAERRAQVVGAVLVAYAVVMFVVPVWGRGTLLIVIGPPMATSGALRRFSVIPIFLLLSALMVLLDGPGRARASWVRVACVVLAVQIVLLTVVDFSGRTSRSSFGDKGPWQPFAEQVDDVYARRCGGQPSDLEVTIPAALGFPMTLTCRDLAP